MTALMLAAMWLVAAALVCMLMEGSRRLDNTAPDDGLEGDLAAVIAAVQDGRVDAPQELADYVECMLHELEFSDGAS